MPDHPDRADPTDRAADLPALEARVERLERLVEELVGARGASPRPDARPTPPPPPHPSPSPTPDTPPPPDFPPSPRPPGSSPPPGSARPAAPRPPRTGSDWLRLGEDWLGRVGLLLLLLGLAFFYRYAVDRGWIMPWLRVSFGLALGGGLLVFGLKRARSRPLFSQVLLGGALAVLYLTGWAARALYELVPWTVGFSFMAMVTVLALALAERREHQVLAVIGAAGGLATPFLLESPTDSVAALVGYAVLLLAWAGLLQLRRGWGVLLAVNVVGGLSVMAAAADAAEGWEVGVVQLGLLSAWAVGAVFPYLQGWLHLGEPAVWPPPPTPRRSAPPDPSGKVSAVLLGLLGVGVSAAAVILTAVAWDLERVGSGLGFLAVAALFLAGSSALRTRPPVARPALGTGAVLLTLGTVLAAGPGWHPLPLALEAAAFLWIAREGEMPLLAILGHLTFGVLAWDFLLHLDEGGDAAASVYAGGFLGVLVVAVGCAVLVLTRPAGRRTYVLGSWAAFLAWLAWQLAPLPGGQGLVSGAWAATALLLLLLGVQARNLPVRMLGLATLAVVAAKLLLVDLSALDRGLRIVLFLGFGALFLGLGYVFKGRDAPIRGEAPDAPPLADPAGGGPAGAV